MTDQANIPQDELEAYRENLDEITRDLARRIGDLAVGANKVPEQITAANENLIVDFITQCTTALKDAEKLRVKTRDPQRARVDAIQDHWKTLTTVLLVPLNRLKDRHGKFRRAEEDRERQRREEKQRVAREAEEKARQEAEQKQRKAEAEARAAKNDEDRRQAAANLERAQKAQAEADAKAEETKEAEKATQASVAVHGDLGGQSFTRGS